MLDLLLKLFFPKGFRRYSISKETELKIKSDWENINSLLKQRGPSQLRQALISADKSLDNALKDLVVGQTMGERLKNAKDKFERSVYNRIWEAHKVRNNLVHESGYEPGYYVIEEAINTIRMALRILNIYV